MNRITQCFNSVGIAIAFLAYPPSMQSQLDLEWKLKNQMKLPAEAVSLAFSADGSLLVVGHRGGVVTVWNKDTDSVLHSFVAGAQDISTVVFTHDGERLITIVEGQGARIWRTTDWNEMGVLDRVASPADISPDGRWLAGQDDGIWLWDLRAMKRSKRLTKANIEGPKTIGFTADGKYIVTAYNYSPMLIDIETGENIQIPIKANATRLNLRTINNDKVAVSLGRLDDDNAITHTARVSHTSDLIAIGRGWYGQSDFVDVWDNNAKKRIGRFKPDDGGIFGAFSHDNSLLAVQSANSLTVWRISDGKKLGGLKCSGPAEFSPRTEEIALVRGIQLLVYGFSSHTLSPPTKKKEEENEQSESNQRLPSRN